MIIFLVQESHTYTHASLVGRKELPQVACRTYDWLLRRRHAPPATYIFTDRERMDHWELRVFAEYYAHLNAAGPGYRAINDPARMKDRQSLLRALYTEGVNRFNAYALSERASGMRFPVFIRRGFDHGQPLTGLLNNAGELDAALAHLRTRREPEGGLLIIEYCAQPVAGKLFRKLAAYRVGGQVFFYNTAHEESWLVKYGTLNAATTALYEDEYRMIRDNAFADRVRQAFEVAGIEYGRADFGLVDGEPQFYEINTNPHTFAPDGKHPQPVRNRSHALAWQKYCTALAALDSPARRGRPAARFRSDGLVKPVRTTLRRMAPTPLVRFVRKRTQR